MALNGLRMSQKQLESFAHADADASKGRVNIWHGAVRSGKTVGSLLAFLVGVANAPEQGRDRGHRPDTRHHSSGT